VLSTVWNRGCCGGPRDPIAGASLTGYELASYTPGDFGPPKFEFLAQDAGYAEGRLTATFEINVKDTPITLAARRRRALLQSSAQLQSGPVALLYARGSSTDGELVEHGSKGSASIDFEEDGAVAGAAAEVEAAQEPSLARVHGWFMAACFGLLMPLGIGVARVGKKAEPWWYYSHIALQLTAAGLMVAGCVMGFLIRGGSSRFSTHRALGITLIVALATQMLLGIARPGKASHLRRTWNLAHWWNGRAVLAIGIANVYVGLTEVYQGDTTGGVIAFSVVLGAVLGAFLLWEACAYARLPPPGHMAYCADTPANGRAAAGGRAYVADDAAGRYIGALDEQQEAGLVVPGDADVLDSSSKGAGDVDGGLKSSRRTRGRSGEHAQFVVSDGDGGSHVA
jgi:uncharacterized membrane protein